MSAKFFSQLNLRNAFSIALLIQCHSLAYAEDLAVNKTDEKTISTKGEATTVVTLPAVTVNEETLGGDILLINMKDYMVIQRNQSQYLEKELGAELKKQFTRDIVMTQSVEFLQAQYGGEKHPVTNEVIKQYAEIINIGKKRKKLD
jgi:hypothetical protein